MTNAERRIENAARKLGYVVRVRDARESRSIYLTCEREDVALIVRVSDHAECYPPSRGARQVSVSPEELTATQAIAALKDPFSVGISLGPADLTDDQKEVLREQSARARSFKKKWQTLRSTLSAETFAQFRSHGGNRPAARKIAVEMGIGAGLAFSALTNGKRFQR